MEIKTFKIPLGDTMGMEEELNKFLRSHRVLKVDRAFCLEGSGYLAVCVEYLPGGSVANEPENSKGGKKDYAKELSAEEFERFEIYRKRRRELALERKLPAYMVFTDADLAQLSRRGCLTEETVLQVPGIQKSRLKEYGMLILQPAFAVGAAGNDNKELSDETGGAFVG